MITSIFIFTLISAIGFIAGISFLITISLKDKQEEAIDYVGLDNILYNYLKEKEITYNGVVYDLKSVWVTRAAYTDVICVELQDKKTGFIHRTDMVDIKINEKKVKE